ncbi:MAG: glycine reductase [Anaerolineae bacterium]|nr:glycine reductase [Anaerolineae bacterium]
MKYPVVKAVTLVLAHVPHFARYGSKPLREIPRDEQALGQIESALRSFDQARDYAPHQVYIGNMRPEALAAIEKPWYAHTKTSDRFGPHGEIIPEDEFYGLMAIADQFDLFRLEKEFAARVRERLSEHPLIKPEELKPLDKGLPLEQIETMIGQGALPLFVNGGTLVGAMRSGHDEDDTLTANVLLENLACKASGAWAMRHLTNERHGVDISQVDYVLGCGEEGVGDRYQRAGGAMGKAMAEFAGFSEASGSDVKAFCAAPIHATVTGASYVQSGLYRNIVVAGGGSLAKLGMKFRGHVKHQMPILEDVLGAVAIVIGPDDGKNPVIRLDGVGIHRVKHSSSPPAMMQALVVEPLERMGHRMTDVDKFALELHNAEITEPAGSGDVALTNYKTLAGIAVMRKEIVRDEMDAFVRERGMPGYSPTQGHIAAAVPFLGHARDRMLNGEMQRAMFVGKGSLFLGRMTNLSDGMSFVVEPNGG